MYHVIPSADKDILCNTFSGAASMDGAVQKITLDGGLPVAMASPNHPDLPYFVQPAPCYWRLVVTEEGVRIKIKVDEWEVRVNCPD